MTKHMIGLTAFAVVTVLALTGVLPAWTVTLGLPVWAFPLIFAGAAAVAFTAGVVAGRRQP